MCGIIGIFHQEKAYEEVKKALALLHKRGQDGFGVTNGKEVVHNAFPEVFHSPHVMGHTLHAVVDHVPQPLKKEGVLVANCEIYNWQELNEKYCFNAKNDAELLLCLLDAFGTEKLNELDGVYAFAYWKEKNLILARDILGEKPLWFSSEKGFAFASEKKVLERLGYQNIRELHPRHILHYDISSRCFESTYRQFFTYLPEHFEPFEEIKRKTRGLLDKAIQKRIPTKKFGLLFSGGIDSTYLAYWLKSRGYDFTCYTAVLETDGVPPTDLVSAQKVAQELGLNLKIKKIKLSDVPSYLQKVVPLIEDSNVVKVGVALTFYAACELAKEDGCKVIFSGLGSEEIFAGYERHKQSQNINRECVSGLLKMYERDLYRDDVVTMAHQLELRLPFLDKQLVEYALRIPEKYKITLETTKFILREIAREQGLPEYVVTRKKTAAQYGSRFDYAIEKLAHQNGYPSKSAYLQTFYPHPNLKLGVLFSGGKDSTYAAYIMQRQNYEPACLITMKSTNPDSYMFHTPAIEITSLQAQAMGIPHVVEETAGEKEAELEDLQRAMQQAIDEYHIDGIVTGAVFSTYQRDRIEKVCDQLGLKLFSPLWHKPQEQEMKELLQNDFSFVFSAVAAEGLDTSWLNRIITERDVEQLQRLNGKYQLNVAGEGGETESLVLDCPLFHQKVQITRAEIVAEKHHTARLVVKEAILVEK